MERYFWLILMLISLMTATSCSQPANVDNVTNQAPEPLIIEPFGNPVEASLNGGNQTITITMSKEFAVGHASANVTYYQSTNATMPEIRCIMTSEGTWIIVGDEDLEGEDL